MAFEVGGDSGALLLGRRVVAQLTGWSKAGRTIKFKVDPASIDHYWANYGPVTEVALHFRTKSAIYPVEPGDYTTGALQITQTADGQTSRYREEPR